MKAEVRGRGRKWRVFYEDESGIATSYPVYDRDGNLKGSVEAGAPTGKLVEAHLTCTSQAEAEDYARWLGADDIKAVRTRTRAEVARANLKRK